MSTINEKIIIYSLHFHLQNIFLKMGFIMFPLVMNSNGDQWDFNGFQFKIFEIEFEIFQSLRKFQI